MTEMTITNLNVDLLQDSASMNLHKHIHDTKSGKSYSTSIGINIPIETPGNQPENKLKKTAIEAAKRALHEALEALDKHQI